MERRLSLILPTNIKQEKQTDSLARYIFSYKTIDLGGHR